MIWGDRIKHHFLSFHWYAPITQGFSEIDRMLCCYWDWVGLCLFLYALGMTHGELWRNPAQPCPCLLLMLYVHVQCTQCSQQVHNDHIVNLKILGWVGPLFSWCGLGFGLVVLVQVVLGLLKISTGLFWAKIFQIQATFGPLSGRIWATIGPHLGHHYI